MGIRELKGWKIVIMKKIKGERRDLLKKKEEVWKILRKIEEERKKREIEKKMSVMREVMMEKKKDESDSYEKERMKEM